MRLGCPRLRRLCCLDWVAARLAGRVRWSTVQQAWALGGHCRRAFGSSAVLRRVRGPKNLRIGKFSTSEAEFEDKMDLMSKLPGQLWLLIHVGPNATRVMKVDIIEPKLFYDNLSSSDFYNFSKEDGWEFLK